MTALTEHWKNGAYPGHMPGHKRVSLGFPDPYTIDITEIEGFDDLHHPNGIIEDLEKRVARIYGVEKAIVSVNGSTAGNLSCIYSALPEGGIAAVSPERHRSVDHALLLKEASEVRLGDWLQALENDRIHCRFCGESPVSDCTMECEAGGVSAVIVTSPGYDGECYDIRALADKCHERGIPLIVDAAHGAHLGFHSFFPEHPAHLGADAVVTSLHKTLPAFTQTSCILIPEGSMISDSVVRRWMDVFETSSPSYILMAGVERCMDYLEKRGQQAFEKYALGLEKLYEDAHKWTDVHLRNYADYIGSRPCDADGVPYAAVDPGKLVLTAEGCTGEEVAQILRSRYHIEPERVTEHDALIMTSVCDFWTR